MVEANSCLCLYLSRRNKALVKELSTPSPGVKDLYFSTEYSQSVWEQFEYCLWKQWLSYWRTPDYNLVRYFFTLICAVTVGTVFWKVGAKRFHLSLCLSSYSIPLLLQHGWWLKSHCQIEPSLINSIPCGLGKEEMSWPQSLGPCIILWCLLELIIARQCSQW